MSRGMIVFSAKALAAALLAVSGALASSSQPAAQPFEFVAMGDMPYVVPDDYAKVDRLVDAINAARPAFTLHVGDIISGRTRCSDENLEKSASQLGRIAGALIYTPGDNEWTDCHRPLGGGFDPVERLAKLRSLMFPKPGTSLGQAPFAVESQSSVMGDRFGRFVENVRFEKNGIHFVTAHVVGSENNFSERPGAMEEFIARNEANVAWLERAFALAVSADARALVIAWQANVHPQTRSKRSDAGFADTISAIEKGAAAFRRPVLVVYGDYHFFDVRRFTTQEGRPVPGVMKMMVYGDRHVHAVRVGVDPASPHVFSFTPLIVPENGLP
jgi:hypothetical protein